MSQPLKPVPACPTPGRRFLRTLFLAAAAASTVACSDGVGDASTSAYPVAVRDSAGIRIVEHADLPPVGFGDWSLDPEPLISVGGFAADEDHQLYRVSGARVLSDGSIAVANAGSGEIRFFSPAGDFLRAEGGKGGGPGEYQFPSLVGITPGDTLVIGDFQNNRVSFLHPDAGFVRSFVANPDGSFGFARGVLSQGAILMGGGIVFGGGGEIEEGLTRQPTEFHLVARDGTAAGDLGQFPGTEMIVTVINSGGETLINARGHPMLRNTESATGGDAVYIGTSDSFEVRRFDLQGNLVQVLRNQTPPPPVTREDLDRYARQEADEADEGDRARILREWSDIDPPATFPAFRDLVVDRVGHLWVQDFDLPAALGSAWTVFDSEGHVAARVATPDHFTVVDIGEDYVLGVLRDDLDAEILQLLRLRRGSPGG
jgi:hypothetical protein